MFMVQKKEREIMVKCVGKNSQIKVHLILRNIYLNFKLQTKYA